MKSIKTKVLGENENSDQTTSSQPPMTTINPQPASSINPSSTYGITSSSTSIYKPATLPSSQPKTTNTSDPFSQMTASLQSKPNTTPKKQEMNPKPTTVKTSKSNDLFDDFFAMDDASSNDDTSGNMTSDLVGEEDWRW